MVTGFNHPARRSGTDGSGLGMRPRRTQQPGFRHGGGGGGVRKGDLGQFTKSAGTNRNPVWGNTPIICKDSSGEKSNNRVAVYR